MAQSRMYRRVLLSTTAAGMALAMTAGALAQDAEEAQSDDVITVTGIRGSILNSIAEKRENTSIVEAISAEDIGKLPDVSIAESLARLPGLAAQRVRGRAQVISVRGLGPDFTTALLNGREQVTAGDNRGVEFDQYPAELINQAIVYKTPDAQLVSQGLAGTVDLRTIRPLSFGERTISLSGSYELNSNGDLNPDFDDNGYRITGTYVDQFANDTVGVVFSIAHQDTPTQGERYEICNFQDRGGAQAPECFKMFAESRDLDRTAVLGTLEFEPSATVNASLDVMYTEFTDGGVRRGVELPTGTWLGGSNTGLDLVNPVVQDGLVTGGEFQNVFAVGRNDVQERTAELFSIGGNIEWRPIDNWTFEGDLSYSRVERSALDFESYFGFAEGGWPDYPSAIDNIGFELDGGQRYRFNSTVGSDYADPNLMVLTDPGGWGQDGFHKILNTEDALTALRGSAVREFNDGFFTSIEAGVYYTNREKERETIESYVDLASGNGADPFPTGSVFGSTSLGHVSNIDVVAYSPTALLNNGTYELRPLPLGFIPNKQWQVEEEVLLGYVQGNFERDMGFAFMRGNAGFQVVHSDQSSTGPIGFGTGFLPVVSTDGDTYTEVLPSLNAAFEVTEDFYIRVGAARTLARARMDDMRASVGVGTNSTICPQNPDGSLQAFIPGADPNGTCVSGGSGDPRLRPYIADGFDLGFEHYFADGAYWSLAFFHKEIDSWVFGNVGRNVVVPEVVDSIFGAGTAAANPGIEQARYFAPENSDGGWLRGVEASLSLPGEVITPRLEGFGLFATYSITDSEIQPSTAANPITIPGLSEDLGNITVYYERGGWEARISNRWRGDFLAELPDFTGQPDFRSAFDESVVDAQIGYEFTEGELEGLTVLLQAQNLTDERFGTFINGDERFARNWEEYGTTYTLRVNWRR